MTDIRGSSLTAAVNAWAYARHPNLVRYFVKRIGAWPNIAEPKTFHEKMLWRKVFDHDPRFITFCDKIAIKDWYAAHCPDLPFARLLWSGEDPGDIPGGLLDRPVLVKASHGCEFNYWVEPGCFDRADLERTARSWLAERYGHRHGEWAYSQIRPRVLVEERLGMERDEPIVDFTAWSFGGRVVIYRVMMNEKRPGERTNVFDGDGNRLDVQRLKPGGKDKPPLPDDFTFPVPAQMLGHYVRRLGGDCDFMRVDFMWADGRLYLCEMTPYPGSGYGRFVQSWVTEAFAKHWDLRRSWFLSTPQKGLRGAYAEALREEADRQAQEVAAA